METGNSGPEPRRHCSDGKSGPHQSSNQGKARLRPAHQEVRYASNPNSTHYIVPENAGLNCPAVLLNEAVNTRSLPGPPMKDSVFPERIQVPSQENLCSRRRCRRLVESKEGALLIAESEMLNKKIRQCDMCGQIGIRNYTGRAAQQKAHEQIERQFTEYFNGGILGVGRHAHGEMACCQHPIGECHAESHWLICCRDR